MNVLQVLLSVVTVSIFIACVTLAPDTKPCAELVTEDTADAHSRHLEVASAEPLNFFGGEPAVIAALLVPSTVGPQPELHILTSLPFGEVLEAAGWHRFGGTCKNEETGVVSVIVTKVLPGEVPQA